MRLLLLLALLLVARLPAAAQANAAISQPSAAPATDTVTAIHRLFLARRTRCTYVVGGTALVTSASVVTVLLQELPPNQGGVGGTDFRPVAATFLGLVGTGIVGIELLTLSGWGRGEEARMVVAFQQHRLPRRIRLRLKPAYFQP